MRAGANDIKNACLFKAWRIPYLSPGGIANRQAPIIRVAIIKSYLRKPNYFFPDKLAV
jgi:hypothetical protein